jgi:CxC2 like cysteine cluster associated with KDZ transposases
MEYVVRIDSLLDSLLSRESLNDVEKQCTHCEKGVWAVWRCKDCSLGITMCRRCMRTTHSHNPFHRIERWTGNFFQPAELWEVGTYLLVKHHVGTPLCDRLRRQLDFLETLEIRKDEEEQTNLRTTSAPTSGLFGTPAADDDDEPELTNADKDDDQSDQAFFQFLNDLHENGADIEDPPDILEMEDEIEEEEKEPPSINPYLGNNGTQNDLGVPYTPSFPFIGTYLRVVHINGVHNIAMINCDCSGQDMVAGDLLACRLLPASFHRIRTLFTVQLLDFYRLSNLELKTSAYHFYHLLRRITAPLDPAGVVDLYREFRRMSRLWRWMKRLKWAGYPCNNTPVNEVKAGELSVFCAACPQPGINIPDNWKEDKARHVSVFYLNIIFIYHIRWVYKRMFVADGNFKADHVRQKKEAGDVWLSEGGGMIPKREEYMSFLKTAIERQTVSFSIMCRRAGAGRRHPCYNLFDLLIESSL